ncbi:hypothetical protein G8A07_23805 [Roseateles sp. DAIF2]|uniref:hypothetical protein n=1 Tax=Roseateles sp. DAIF2 TaxID=2714952 RepID=UPI0018A3254A|nr:hypothetical protein [Roseateles sp. DAIF2]QPF75643.1 hypothetical protein G8A07_23805 [Roseateles sp. DAIF2]
MAHDRDYVIFDHRGETGQRAGVRVSTKTGQTVEFACSGPVLSRLSTLRDLLLPCDQDSALNGGLCPDQAPSKPGK